MILRRVMAHVKAQNWFAVAIDFVIVVVGVFIGIQFSNWNEARGERAQAHEDRQRLIADLNSNQADLVNRLRYFRAVQGHAQATLAALAKSNAGSDQDFLVHAYQASQVLLADPKRVTYDEILATGRLTRLGDPQLRDAVGNFYVTMASALPFLNNVPEYRDHLRRTMPGAIQITIRERCPERYDYLPDGTLLNSLPARCDPGLDPDAAAAAAPRVRGMTGATEDLNRLIDDLNVKMEVIGSALDQVRALRVKLAKADART
jgi:hypothetical protein